MATRRNVYVSFVNRVTGTSSLRGLRTGYTDFRGILKSTGAAAFAMSLSMKRLGQSMSNASLNITRAINTNVRHFAQQEKGVAVMKRELDASQPIVDAVNKHLMQFALQTGINGLEMQKFAAIVGRSGMMKPFISEVTATEIELEALYKAGELTTGQFNRMIAQTRGPLVTGIVDVSKVLGKMSVVFQDFSEGAAEGVLRNLIAMKPEVKTPQQLANALKELGDMYEVLAKSLPRGETALIKQIGKFNILTQLMQPSGEYLLAFIGSMSLADEQMRTMANRATAFTLEVLTKPKDALELFTDTMEKFNIASEEEFMDAMNDQKKVLPLITGMLAEYADSMLKGDKLMVDDARKVDVINEAYKSLGTTISDRLAFQTYAATGGFQKMQKFSESTFDSLVKDLRAGKLGAGAMEDSFKDMQETIDAAINRFDEFVRQVKVQIGEEVLPIFRDLITMFKEGVSQLNAWRISDDGKKFMVWVREHGAKTLVFAFVAGKLITLAGNIGLIVSGFATMFSFGGVAKMIAFFGLPLAVVGVAVLISGHFDEIIKKAREFSDNYLDGKIKVGFDLVLNLVEAIGKRLEEIFNSPTVQKFLDKVSSIAIKIGEISGGVVVAGLKGATELIAPKPSLVGKEIKNVKDLGLLATGVGVLPTEKSFVDGMNDLGRKILVVTIAGLEQGIHGKEVKILEDDVTIAAKDIFAVITGGIIRTLESPAAMVAIGGILMVSTGSPVFLLMGALLGGFKIALDSVDWVEASVKFYEIIDYFVAKWKYVYDGFVERVLEISTIGINLFDSIKQWIEGWINWFSSNEDEIVPRRTREDAARDVKEAYDRIGENVPGFVGGNQTGAIYRKPTRIGNRRVGEAREEAVIPIDRSSSIPSLQKGLSSAQVVRQPVVVQAMVGRHELAKIMFEIQSSGRENSFRIVPIGSSAIA